MAKHKLTLISILVVLLATTVTAEAEDKTGWSLSAAIGSSRIEDKDGTDTFSGNGFGFSAEIEYRFSLNFALGLGGFTLGRAEDTFSSVDTQITVHGFDLFGRVILPVSDKVDVFGRIGSTIYFVDIDPGNVNFVDALFGEEAVELGLGVDFGRQEKLAYRLEGRFFNGGSDETGTLLMVGVNYLF